VVVPVAFLAVLLLAACGPTASSGTPAAVSATPAESAATAAFPTGTFKPEGSAGKELTFNEDGTFVVQYESGHAVKGTYSVNGDVYTEESNDAGCPVPMHYEYAFDGVNLTFMPVEDPAEDPCGGRVSDFSETTRWVLTD
jgi:hypothetical protein